MEKLNSKSKILFNTYPGAYFEKGGGEVQLESSASALQDMGYTIIRYNQWSPDRNVDILHQFTCTDGTEFVINGYKKLGTKIVVAPIIWPLNTEYDRWSKPRISNIFRSVDIVFTNSHGESKLLSDFYETPIEKFHKTRNAIHSAYLTDATDQLFRSQFNIKGPYALTVANIDRRKNTLALVKSCLKAGIKLISIGHTKDIPYYEEVLWTVKDYKNAKDFIHLGPIEHMDTLKSAYSGASVFLLPSLCETPGIAALEAASQGAKIVITNVGPTKEYFGNFVTYADPLDEQNIQACIESELQAVRNPDAIKQHIRSTFTWNLTAEDIHQGYNKL